MFDRTDVIYSYDGSFNGLMCCVFTGYSAGEIPSDIIIGEPEQLSFCSIKYIETVPEQYERILRSIPLKMGKNALDFIQKSFLTCHPNKDRLILEFMYLAYNYGSCIFNMLTNDVVNALNKAVLHCSQEAHLLQGFIRFSDSGGGLSAVIEPKNLVSPLIAGHFVDRYRNEDFLIYDKTHHMALIYAEKNPQIINDVTIELPEITDEEAYYQNLWKAFYDSIGIKERFNPRCRMNLMPKRYWGNMVEVRDEINKLQNAPRPSGLSSLEKRNSDNVNPEPVILISNAHPQR